ncbi:MAG: DUF2029 domain-containing protein [Candidatus Sumerlaeia bacterium]|nr:DUF2029 domain-containing protein [Candidatus Sumerlaeia bacterium]
MKKKKKKTVRIPEAASDTSCAAPSDTPLLSDAGCASPVSEAPAAAASPNPPLAWLLAGFVLVYFPLFLVPVFFNSEHTMRDLCPVFIMKNVGIDLKEILEFSRAWAIEGKTPYVGSNSYPPLEAVFFTPALYLNFHVAYTLLTLASLACFVWITLVLPAWMNRGAGGWGPIVFFVATGLFSHGLLFELERGQFNLIAMAFCLTGVYLFHFHPRRRIWSYVLFSLSMQLKVFPAIFALMFVDNWRDWKTVLRRFAWIGAANFLCLFVLGFQAFSEFLESTRWKIENPFPWLGNHSLLSYSGFVQATWGIPQGILLPVLTAATLAMVGVMAGFSIARRVEGFNPHLLVGCTLAALVIPAVSHDYTLSFLAGPTAMLFGRLRLDGGARWSPWMLRAIILAVAFAYSTTLFSIYHKREVCALPLAMATPMLLAMLAGVTLLFLAEVRRDSNSPPAA